jgi:hypothetical protein
MTVLTLVSDDKFSADTREAMAFLRKNDPTGAFAYVARSILSAADMSVCLNEAWRLHRTPLRWSGRISSSRLGVNLGESPVRFCKV